MHVDMYVIDPVNLVESVPLNVNSPFLIDVMVVLDSKDMPTMVDVIEEAISDCRGVYISGDKVSIVRSNPRESRCQRGFRAMSFALTRGYLRNL
jgi:hypothetical protein